MLSVHRQSMDVLVIGTSTDTGTGDGWGYVLSIYEQSTDFLGSHSCPWLLVECVLLFGV